MNKTLFFLIKNKTLPLYISVFFCHFIYVFIYFSFSSPEFLAPEIANIFCMFINLFLIVFYKKINRLVFLTIFVLELTAYGLILTLCSKIACGFEFIITACIPGIFLLAYDENPPKSYYFILDVIFIASVAVMTYVRLNKLPPQQFFLPERRKFLIINEIFFTCASLMFLIYGSIITDIAMKRLDRKRAYFQKQLDYIAKHDPLTGLMNRRRTHQVFSDVLNMKIKDNQEFAISIFDIDNFKKINDTYGHDAGDFILKTFTARVWKEFPEPIRISRWGGEEFLIIFPQIDENTIYRLEEARKRIVAEPIIYDNKTIPVTATFGFSSSRKFQTPDLVLADADKMLLTGKQNGKNRIVVSPDF